jgi:hypothetical protein
MAFWHRGRKGTLPKCRAWRRQHKQEFQAAWAHYSTERLKMIDWFKKAKEAKEKKKKEKEKAKPKYGFLGSKSKAYQEAQEALAQAEE